MLWRRFRCVCQPLSASLLDAAREIGLGRSAVALLSLRGPVIGTFSSYFVPV